MTCAFYSKLLFHLQMICLFVHQCTPMKAHEEDRRWHWQDFLFLFVCLLVIFCWGTGWWFIFSFFFLRGDEEVH